MAKKKQENSKLDLYRQRMSELIKGIFGYKQIDFEPKGEDTPKSVTIKLRHNDIVHTFNQTRIYHDHFEYNDELLQVQYGKEYLLFLLTLYKNQKLNVNKSLLKL